MTNKNRTRPVQTIQPETVEALSIELQIIFFSSKLPFDFFQGCVLTVHGGHLEPLIVHVGTEKTVGQGS